MANSRFIYVPHVDHQGIFHRLHAIEFLIPISSTQVSGRLQRLLHDRLTKRRKVYIVANMFIPYVGLCCFSFPSATVSVRLFLLS